MVLGEEVVTRLRGLLPPADLLPRPDRDARLVLLVARVVRVTRRVEERREAFLLVVVEHLDPRGGRGDEDEDDGERPQEAEAGEVPPRDPGDEEHRHHDRDVDQGGAEVGLEHHERGGHEREQHRPRCRVPVPEAAAAIDDERREHHHDEDLAELGGLEGEEGELDGPPRAAGDVAEGHDRHQRGDHQREDAPAQLAQTGVVHPREHERDDRADGEVDGLALHEEALGVAVDLDGGERHQRARADPRDRDRHHEVERQAEAAATQAATARAAGAAGLLGGRWGDRAAHRVTLAPALKGPGVLRYHCEKIWRTSGAAASAPKPPPSTVATTRSGFVFVWDFGT